jgi:hypothetical protein
MWMQSHIIKKTFSGYVSKSYIDCVQVESIAGIKKPSHTHQERVESFGLYLDQNLRHKDVYLINC